MVQKKKWIALLGLLAILLIALPAMAQDLAPSERVHKNITLEDWSNSSLNEKYAFLLGMATMLELDKYLRNNNYDDNAVIDKWAAGFAGPTFAQIVGKIDDYVKANPDKMNEDLLRELWYQVVVPSAAANEAK